MSTDESAAVERRQILMGFAGAAGLAGIGAWAVGRSVGAERRSKTDMERLTALVDDLLAADDDTVLRIAGAPLSAGLDPARVLEAAFLMPMWSEGAGGDIHAMAAVPAIARLVQESRGPRRLVPVMWAVAEALRWSGKTRVAPDAGATDGRANLTECARPREDPHVAIWAAQAARMISALPELEPMVQNSVRRYAELRSGGAMKVDAVRTDETSTTSSTEIAQAIRDGADIGAVSTRALFESLAWLCVETRLTDATETGLGVHQTTLLDALWRIQDTGLNVAAQAYTWVTSVYRKHGRALDTAPSVLPEGAGDPFLVGAPDPVATYRAALTAVGKDEAAFLTGVADRLVDRGKDAHDFKYWDAVRTIGDRLAGEARTRWLACLSASSTVRIDSRWTRSDEAQRLVQP